MAKKRIYRYQVHFVDKHCIEMPRGAIILSAIAQDGFMVIYALVEQDEALVQRVIHIRGTGYIIDECIDVTKFIGTVKCSETLVFHLFDGGEIVWLES